MDLHTFPTVRTHTHTFGLGWVGGWGGDGNIPWTCIHSQLYAHTHTHTFGLGWVGGVGMVTYLGLAYIPNCTRQLLKTCTRQPAHMEHTKYTTVRTNWYIQQTHVGATQRNANKNNKNYHVLQNQLLLLLTRNTTAKDLYKTTCTHGAHKIHSCKNKLVHTANPFRVYRRGPCPRVQMRPLTACTDEAPPGAVVAVGALLLLSLALVMTLMLLLFLLVLHSILFRCRFR